jgi:uncharacterized membrane protein YccC
VQYKTSWGFGELALPENELGWFIRAAKINPAQCEADAKHTGDSSLTFVAITVLLLSPRGDLAYAGALAFALGTAGAIFCAAIIKFAVLPGLETFPAFCVALGLFLIPASVAMAQSRQPAMLAVLTAMVVNFGPLLAPANQMSYDTAQFYNSALAIFAGCAAAPLSFLLVPPLSPAFRTRRLLDLAVRDLRRLAVHPAPSRFDDWEGRMYGRLSAMPEQATPLQRARMLAALSLGGEIIRLRPVVGRLGLGADLQRALAAVAQGQSATAITRLARLDEGLADRGATEPEPLRARASILVISEVLREHAAYFDAGAPG